MAQPKIMTVYGTRPEAIKVAPVIKALETDDRFESIAVSTGQHKEMLAQVNTMFGISPKHDLSLMKPGQSLNELVARAITGLDAILKKKGQTSLSPKVILRQRWQLHWLHFTGVYKLFILRLDCVPVIFTRHFRKKLTER